MNQEQDNWFDFKKEPFYTKDCPLIIYTEFEEMAIVYWKMGWNGLQWYSADEEHYYREQHILYWMQAPKTPKKSARITRFEKAGLLGCLNDVDVSSEK